MPPEQRPEDAKGGGRKPGGSLREMYSRQASSQWKGHGVETCLACLTTKRSQDGWGRMSHGRGTAGEGGCEGGGGVGWRVSGARLFAALKAKQRTLAFILSEVRSPGRVLIREGA